MNRKGFTLVELLATLVILGIIVSIGGVAITKTIANSKQKNDAVLLANIKSAVEIYYQECNYGELSSCENPVKASTLINKGYIKSNYTKGTNKYLIYPSTEGKKDAEIKKICTISYSYSDNKLNTTITPKTGLTATGC